jgi:hypothetical protein
MNANSPVGTTLAILERTLKTMSAIQARVHYSMKQELGLLKKIIAAYTPEDYDYEPVEGSRMAKRSDYDNVNVIPVSDPNASTMAQKIVQYQAVLQLAQSAPQMYNMPLLHRQMLDVLGIKDSQKLIPMDEDQLPKDPVTENQNILMQKPVKAFVYQNHQAHIQVHMTAMQNPHIQQLMQGNPAAQTVQSAMMAHINEHLGFEYRVQIEQQLGFALPPQQDESGEDIPMDPQVEAQLAPMLAQASQRLLEISQSQKAQQQAQQQAQDPIVQMQMQELQIKAAEQQRKAQKDAQDAQLRQAQLAVEQQRINSQQAIAQAQIEAKKHNEARALDVDALKAAAQMKQQTRLETSRNNINALKAMVDIKHKDEQQKKELFADALKNIHMKKNKGE